MIDEFSFSSNSNISYSLKEERYPDFPHLHFRSIQPKDREQIQALHEDWFPVTYQDEFYDAMVHGHLHANAEEDGDDSDIDDMDENTYRARRPLFTYLAVANPLYREKQTTCLHNIITRHSSTDLCRMEEARVPVVSSAVSSCTLSSSAAAQDVVTFSGENRIVSCVVGTVVERGILSPELRNMLVPDPTRHPRLFYIMTLGTASDYRQAGLASFMVKKCMDWVQQDPRCGTMYLHVLDTNVPAIRFYEKLGFYRVKLIQNYYSIDGKPRNCFLYATYFHGNRGHLTVMALLKRALGLVWRQLTSPLSLWMSDSSLLAADTASNGSSASSISAAE